MKRTNRWVVAVQAAALVTATLQLTGCRKALEAHETEHPAEVEAIPGSDVDKVTLTERAVQRLDVKTDQVREQDGRRLVPYSSVIYDPKGLTWVYINTAPRTFVRQQVEIDRIVGNQVILKGGPDPGTAVASQAVAELYGAELGVGH